jgi:hypothetical protein
VEYRGRPHEQFYDLLEIKIVSQHTYSAGPEASVCHTLADSDDSGEEDDNDSMNGL